MERWFSRPVRRWNPFADYCDCLRIYRADRLLDDGSAFARGYWIASLRP